MILEPPRAGEAAPSPVAWLRGAHLPVRWPIKKIKYLAQLAAGVSITSESISPTGAFPVYGANGLRGFTTGFTHAGVQVLVGRQGALCGNVHLADGRFWASEHAIVVTPGVGVDARWLAYLLRVMNLGQYSVATAQPGIAAGVVANLDAHVPSHHEQRQMADFLDREVAKIDALIAKQENLIEVLRQRERAIYDQRLLFPEDARSTSMRRVLKKLDRPARLAGEVVTVYRDGAVTLRSKRRAAGYTESAEAAGYQGIKQGDLAFHGLDGFAGAVGISDSDGIASPVYHVCVPRAGDSPEYLALLLRQLGLAGYLTAQGNSVRQRSVDFRNWAVFGRVPLELPDVSIQRAVVAELTAKTAQTAKVIAKTECFIELSKERRLALITAAVTGQIDVEGAAA